MVPEAEGDGAADVVGGEIRLGKLFAAVGVDMQSAYFSVSTAEIVVIAEGSAESMAAVEMVTMSTGTFTNLEAIEIIDSKSMTSAMETANKVVSAYQAPNK